MPHSKALFWWLLILTLGSSGCIFGGQTGEGVTTMDGNLAGAGGWMTPRSSASGWTSSRGGAGGWTSTRGGAASAGLNETPHAGAAGEQPLYEDSEGNRSSGTGSAGVGSGVATKQR